MDEGNVHLDCPSRCTREAEHIREDLDLNFRLDAKDVQLIATWSANGHG